MERTSGNPKRRRWIYIVAGLVVIYLGWPVAVAMLRGPALFDRVYIEFDWEQSKGFKRIVVTHPLALVPLHGRLIVLQAERLISSEFRKAGWKAAKGSLSVWTLLFLVAVDLDRGSDWHIIDPEVTPLMHAAEEGNPVLVERLVAEGADVNAQDQRGYTALMHASMGLNSDNDAAAKALLAAGADPNVRDREGRTALLWAALRCQPKVGAALVAAGADVNAKDEYGWTPLLSVTSMRCSELVEGLLAAGADVNAQAQEGWTALILASIGRFDDGDAVAKRLLAAGANPNIRGYEGRTALLEAAGSCRPELAAALIAAGADVNARDQHGITPLSETGASCKELRQILKQAGATE